MEKIFSLFVKFISNSFTLMNTEISDEKSLKLKLNVRSETLLGDNSVS